MKLVELKGSKKQIKWANDIRKNMIDRLEQDTKLVDKYLQMADDPNTDQQELEKLQSEIDDQGMYSDGLNAISWKVTPIKAEDICDEQAFNDEEEQAISFYSDAGYSSQEEARKDLEKVKADYLKAGGQKVWDLCEKYYGVSDKYGIGSEQAEKALREWQKEAEKVRLTYIKNRWNEKLINEESSSWYINNRMKEF
ncbi:hypothetical protein [Lactobacillus helveticus]|uniref:hypothetical protein n=1 Tax=Lactobacillus helveticus TaxID=1587 RepID=UPI00062A580D|nr:hypothetical protein [Lactobacillus helveticus]AKG66664.1 hypothetical protein TU99_04945 [Lactobacillus helveticus]